jgi:hypothetical protein
MDQVRQIRLAIPPFFLLASLLWGAYLGRFDLPPILKPGTAKEALGLLAAAAVAILPAGYLISTISVMLLRGLFAMCGKPTYETVLDDATLDRIWSKLRSGQPKDAKLILYAAATFNHELLAPGIHTWILRRWNSFNVAAHSIVALALAHALAPFISIPQGCWWWATTGVLIALLGWTAVIAWRETMRMIKFQSHRQQKGGEVTKDGAG